MAFTSPQIRCLLHLGDVGHVELNELAIERLRGRPHVGHDQIALDRESSAKRLVPAALIRQP